MGPNQSLLLLLLGLIAAAVESMQRGSRAVGAIGGAGVPGVGIEDHNGAGSARDEYLIGMIGERIGEDFGW